MKIKIARPFLTKNDQNQIVKWTKKPLHFERLASVLAARKLEEKFKANIPTAHAIASSSCTAALHGIMLSLEPKRSPFC